MGGRPAPNRGLFLPLPESGELPEEDSETDLSPRLPAAHLIGKDPHLIGKDPISLIRIPSHW